MNRRLLALILLIIALVAVPFGIREYYVGILTQLVINAILVVSFRFILQMGELSLAHVVMMGFGGYMAAILFQRFDWPFWVAMPMGGLASATFALVVSQPLLRMKSFYFFVGSFAVGEVMRLCWLRFKVPFGGHIGLVRLYPPALYAIDLKDPVTYYLFALFVALLCIIIMYRLERSRLGGTLKAIASNDRLAQSVGIDVRGYKTQAFVIGSFFAGIAGVLLTFRLNSISASQYTMTYGLSMLVWVIVGGKGRFFGPILGLSVLMGFRELMIDMGITLLAPLIYGLLLIVTLIFIPDGFIALPERIMGRRRKDKRTTDGIVHTEGEQDGTA